MSDEKPKNTELRALEARIESIEQKVDAAVKELESAKKSLKRLHYSRIQPVNMAKEVDEGG